MLDQGLRAVRTLRAVGGAGRAAGAGRLHWLAQSGGGGGTAARVGGRPEVFVGG